MCVVLILIALSLLFFCLSLFTHTHTQISVQNTIRSAIWIPAQRLNSNHSHNHSHTRRHTHNHTKMVICVIASVLSLILCRELSLRLNTHAKLIWVLALALFLPLCLIRRNNSRQQHKLQCLRVCLQRTNRLRDSCSCVNCESRVIFMKPLIELF